MPPMTGKRKSHFAVVLDPLPDLCCAHESRHLLRIPQMAVHPCKVRGGTFIMH